jgi:hypothetical protein
MVMCLPAVPAVTHGYNASMRLKALLSLDVNAWTASVKVRSCMRGTDKSSEGHRML